MRWRTSRSVSDPDSEPASRSRFQRNQVAIAGVLAFLAGALAAAVLAGDWFNEVTASLADSSTALDVALTGLALVPAALVFWGAPRMPEDVRQRPRVRLVFTSIAAVACVVVAFALGAASGAPIVKALGGRPGLGWLDLSSELGAFVGFAAVTASATGFGLALVVLLRASRAGAVIPPPSAWLSLAAWFATAALLYAAATVASQASDGVVTWDEVAPIALVSLAPAAIYGALGLLRRRESWRWRRLMVGTVAGVAALAAWSSHELRPQTVDWRLLGTAQQGRVLLVQTMDLECGEGVHPHASMSAFEVRVELLGRLQTCGAGLEGVMPSTTRIVLGRPMHGRRVVGPGMRLGGTPMTLRYALIRPASSQNPSEIGRVTTPMPSVIGLHPVDARAVLGTGAARAGIVTWRGDRSTGFVASQDPQPGATLTLFDRRTAPGRRARLGSPRLRMLWSRARIHLTVAP